MLDTSAVSFDALLKSAADQLRGQGWTILRRHKARNAPWHLVGGKARRVRVVQVMEPATPPAERQEARLRLGDAARLPRELGTMEQWLGHVRPDGRCQFGIFLLNAQHWAPTDARPDMQQVYLDLGIASLPTEAA